MIINDPHGQAAGVDYRGRVQANSTGFSEQADAAVEGDAYNLNTTNITLTSANESAIFYIKNTAEDRDLIINRVFVATVGAATGSIDARIAKNPSSGTIITGTVLPLHNFNFGSAKTASVDARAGGEGSTVVALEYPVDFLFPVSTQRSLVEFETIVLPRGASMALLLTPPAGNTSLVVQAGVNAYLRTRVT